MQKTTRLFYFFVIMACYFLSHAMEEKTSSLDESSLTQSTLHKKFIKAIAEGIYATWVQKMNGANTEQVCTQIQAYLTFFPHDLTESAKQKFVILKAKKMASQILQRKKIYDAKTKNLTAIYTYYDGRQSTSISNWLTMYRLNHPSKKESPWVSFSFEKLLTVYGKIKAQEQTLRETSEYNIWKEINGKSKDKKTKKCSLCLCAIL